MKLTVSPLPEATAGALAGLAVIRDSTVRPELRDYARSAAAALERLARERDAIKASVGKMLDILDQGGLPEDYQVARMEVAALVGWTPAPFP